MTTPALPALVTPLTAAGDLHVDDLARLVASAVAEGAAGVLVAGSTGEGALLGVEGRAELTRRTRAIVDASPYPDALVVAGASGATLDDVHADVARLAAAGADRVLVLAPHTYPLRPEELAAAHLAVADRAEVDTFVYHIPHLTGSSLTPDALAEVAAHDRIVGVKDSSPDAARRAAFVTAVRGRSFAVFTGHAPSLRAALSAGVHGSITAIANVRLRAVLALHAAVAEGDERSAERRQEELDRVTAALAQVGTSVPAALKAALQLEGRTEERWCRPPLASVPPPHLDRVRTALLR